MEAWAAETMLIRMMAVIFVLALLHGGEGRSRSTAALHALLVAVFFCANFARGGMADLAVSLAGATLAAIAVIFSAPRIQNTPPVVTGAAAAGALLGPAGIFVAGCLAGMLNRIDRLRAACGSDCPDRFARPEMQALEAAGTAPLEYPARSGMHHHRGRFEIHRPAAAAPAVARAIPVRIQFAVAILAVLMTDLFV